MIKQVLLLGLVATLLASIHVRPERAVQEVSIKLGEESELDFPDFPFHDIYDRGIWQTNNLDQEIALDDICRKRASQIELIMLNQVVFHPEHPRKPVIYELDDIKKNKDVVDMHFLNPAEIYVVFENATLVIFTLESQTLVISKQLAFPNVKEIEYGEFHPMKKGKRLLFMTDTNAYLLTPSNITVMDGYHPTSKSFTSATPIGEKYIAVGYETLGVVFYEMVSDWYLKQSGGYAASFFNRTSISVQDLAYHENSSTLLILDDTYGVYAAQVHLNPEGHLRMTVIPKGAHKKGCYIMMLVEGDLYIVCRQVFKFGIMTDSITQKLDNPWFKVKKMSVFGNLLVLMGENFFKVYHNDRFVEDFEYDHMDRFHIIDNRTFMSVNEDGITYGNYKLDPPIILCHTSNQRHEGSINAIVRTEAECNQEYFDKYNVDIPFNDTDTCVYTSPVTLLFWRPNDLNLLPFKIIALILLVLIIGLIIWACFVRREALYLRDLIVGYKKVSDPKSKPDYDNMVELKECKSTPQQVDLDICVPKEALPPTVEDLSPARKE